MQSWVPGLFIVGASILGCEKRAPEHYITNAPPAERTPDSPAVDIGAEIQRDLLAVGRDYKSWKLMSDAARWAPTMCAAPRTTELHLSSSRDDRTHGRKLYYLRCNQPDIYDWVDRNADANYRVPAGLSIVKEAHVPVELKSGESAPHNEVFDGSDKSYRIGAVTSLFVMTKYDESTPKTDRGWVYATLDADGTTITSAGAIQSCIECHSETKKDRLFGFKNP